MRVLWQLWGTPEQAEGSHVDLLEVGGNRATQNSKGHQDSGVRMKENDSRRQVADKLGNCSLGLTVDNIWVTLAKKVLERSFGEGGRRITSTDGR